MIEVDVWADVRCPWCWIGWRRMQRAGESVDQPVRVRRRSFPLEPEGPATPGRPIAEVAVHDWGMSAAQWEARSRLIRAEGAREGLHIDVDSARTFDSVPVLRLLTLVSEIDSENAESAWGAAFVAHLQHNEDLGDRSVLGGLAASWGLDAPAVDRALTEERFLVEVHSDVDEARRRGVTSVPTVVAIDGQRLSGSRSVDDLRDFLLTAGAAR